MWTNLSSALETREAAWTKCVISKLRGEFCFVVWSINEIKFGIQDSGGREGWIPAFPVIFTQVDTEYCRRARNVKKNGTAENDVRTAYLLYNRGTIHAAANWATLLYKLFRELSTKDNEMMKIWRKAMRKHRYKAANKCNVLTTYCAVSVFSLCYSTLQGYAYIYVHKTKENVHV